MQCVQRHGVSTALSPQARQYASAEAAAEAAALEPMETYCLTALSETDEDDDNEKDDDAGKRKRRGTLTACR
jgi:hypothetical protein